MTTGRRWSGPRAAPHSECHGPGASTTTTRTTNSRDTEQQAADAVVRSPPVRPADPAHGRIVSPPTHPPRLPRSAPARSRATPASHELRGPDLPGRPSEQATLDTGAVVAAEPGTSSARCSCAVQRSATGGRPCSRSARAVTAALSASISSRSGSSSSVSFFGSWVTVMWRFSPQEQDDVTPRQRAADRPVEGDAEQDDEQEGQSRPVEQLRPDLGVLGRLDHGARLAVPTASEPA